MEITEAAESSERVHVPVAYFKVKVSQWNPLSLVLWCCT